MQMFKCRQNGKEIEAEESPASFMLLVPPPPNVCCECAREHPAEYPHDKQSLYYQMKFQMEHGRGATWADAMAHCPEQVKTIWTEELQKLGVEVDR